MIPKYNPPRVNAAKKKRKRRKKGRLTEESVFWNAKRDGNKKGKAFARGPLMGD